MCKLQCIRRFAGKILTIMAMAGCFTLQAESQGPYTESLPEDRSADRLTILYQDKNIHDLWDVILQIYVSMNGLVDYKALKLAEDDLQEYLSALAKEVPGDDWETEDALAYWINTYNAFTVKLILDHYPVSSIKEIYSGKPFDEPFISLGGENYSLNQIEKEIIFGMSDDPRIHFAINCAARSCPPLYYKAYRGNLLDKQLELVTHKFVNDSSMNTITRNRIEVSRIFEWYKKDFGDLRNFLYRYSMQEIPGGVGIRFKEYDWSLNEK